MVIPQRILYWPGSRSGYAFLCPEVIPKEKRWSGWVGNTCAAAEGCGERGVVNRSKHTIGERFRDFQSCEELYNTNERRVFSFLTLQPIFSRLELFLPILTWWVALITVVYITTTWLAAKLSSAGMSQHSRKWGREHYTDCTKDWIWNPWSIYGCLKRANIA